MAGLHIATQEYWATFQEGDRQGKGIGKTFEGAITRLKIRCPKGRAGSTPALGTKDVTVFATSINLALVRS